MAIHRIKLLIGVGLCCLLLQPRPAVAAGSASLVPLADFETQARSRTSGRARVPLAPPTADALHELDSFEPQGSDRIPNFARALATVKPNTAKPFAHLLKTFAYDGNLPPALK